MEIKKDAVKVAAPAVTAAKVEAPKAPAVKAEPAKKEAPKAAAKKAPAKKAAAKKPAAKKAAAKKPAAKKAAAKVEEIVVQFGGREWNLEEVKAKVAAASGKKNAKIYIKPEEGKAYFVVGGKDGAVEL